MAAVVARTCRPPSGNVVKHKPAGSQAFTKSEYDSLGREVRSFIGYDVDETTYAEALDVFSDTICEQTETGKEAKGGGSKKVSGTNGTAGL